jgi:hypothetical protein
MLLKKSILAPFTTQTLKVLHIRKSSVDMEEDDLGADPDPDIMTLAEFWEFANWAFGPDGLPTLKLLAFGDFSYKGRFHVHNKLLCRHTRSIRDLENNTSQQGEDELILRFRPVRRNDRELWDLIDRNAEFLEACPTAVIVSD